MHILEYKSGKKLFQDYSARKTSKNPRAILQYVDVEKIILSQSIIRNVEFYACEINDCFWQDAVFENVIFNRCDMMETSFRGSTFKNVEFYDVLGSDTDFSLVNCDEVKFFGSRFDGANFNGAKMQRVTFRKNNIGGKCSLNGAIFSAESLAGVMFDGANYDADTKFPEEFPVDEHHGLILTL